MARSCRQFLPTGQGVRYVWEGQAMASPANRALTNAIAFGIDLGLHARRLLNFSYPLAHGAQRASGVGASPEANRATFLSRESLHGQYSILQLRRSAE
jgi:hypothetical protein